MGETVTVRAKSPEKGKVFVGWQDENGDIVCEDREYTFVVTKQTTLTAVYKTEDPGNSGNSGSSNGSNDKENSDGSDNPGNPGNSGGKEKPDLTKGVFIGALVGATTGCFVLVVGFLF